jgi:hypothetical protein
MTYYPEAAEALEAAGLPE